jgi:selenocysteine lyase/cysteine desulfurase
VHEGILCEPGREAMPFYKSRYGNNEGKRKNTGFLISKSLAHRFTKNATEALNVAIKGTKKRDHVITTCMEHNSVIRPLKTLERDMGIELTIVKGMNSRIGPCRFQKHIRSNTRLIISTFSSNVNGIVMPVKEIGRIAAENGILFLLDASQGPVLPELMWPI